MRMRTTTSVCFQLIAAAALTGCSDLLGGMAASYCDVSDDEYLLDPHNDGEPVPPIDCNYTKGQARTDGTCRHYGNNWKHNWAADFWGNELYPDSGGHIDGTSDDFGYGCDAVFKTNGKSVALDGYKKNAGAKANIFEMKTGAYESIQAKSCPDTVKQQMLEKLVGDFKTSIMKEEPIAVRCGFRYQIVFTDHTLAGKATDYAGNDTNVDIETCDGCRSPPGQPDGYVSTNSVPLETGFTRFWLDASGQLQSEHHEGGW